MIKKKDIKKNHERMVEECLHLNRKQKFPNIPDSVIDAATLMMIQEMGLFAARDLLLKADKAERKKL